MKKLSLILLIIICLSSCIFREEYTSEEAKALCPVQVKSLSWARPYTLDRIYATVENTSDKDISRLYIELRYTIITVSGDHDVRDNEIGRLTYDRGLSAGVSENLEWILTLTDTLELNEEDSHIIRIVFADGSEWLWSDYVTVSDYDYFDFD